MSDVVWTVTEFGTSEAQIGCFYPWAKKAHDGFYSARVTSVDYLVDATNIALGSLELAKAWAEAIARVPS